MQTERRKEPNLTGEVMSLRENINAMSVRLEALYTKHEKLEKSIHDLVAVQTAIRGTGTFFGWISDTAKYISLVVASVSAAAYFILELMHRGAK